MEFFICKICKKECNSLNGLLRHSSLSHGIKSETVYIDYILNGIVPKCECGCGETPPFISIGKGFSRFIRSHHNRVPGKNNFHKNPESKIKSARTQSENWKKGMYRKWWEEETEETKQKIEGIKHKLRNNKERGEKISKSLMGIPKTEESKIKTSISQKERYKNNPELKTLMSKKRIEWLKRKQKKKKTNLEESFESILNLLKIKNEYQYEFKNRLFDFYLEDHNALIEVDGDFYHCNPIKFQKPTYKVQEITIKNDVYKDELCKNHNIILIRYWEKDINEKPEWVISDLKQKLGIM